VTRRWRVSIVASKDSVRQRRTTYVNTVSMRAFAAAAALAAGTTVGVSV